MVDEPAASTNKRDFGYASMGPRRKRLAGAIACVSLVCLGVGIAVGVLVERSFSGHGRPAASVAGAEAVGPSSTAANSSVASSTTTTVTASRPTIVLVGDVHTQLGSDVGGWATRLQSRYVRSVDVVNRGLAEFTTERFVETALPIVSTELTTAFTPAVLTLWFGSIDAALPDGPAALDHVHVESYYDNLVHILRTFRKRSPHTQLLVVSPAVVDDDARLKIFAEQGEPSGAIDRRNNVTAAYAMACGEAANVLRDDNIAFLDLYAYLMRAYPNATTRATLFRDGFRFSAEGERIVYEQVYSGIQKLLPVATLETFQIPTPKAPTVGH